LEPDGSPAALVVNPRGYKFAHYATFPLALVTPMILSSAPAKCCPDCGKGWVRMTEPTGSRVTAAYKTLGFRPSCDCDAGEPVPGVVLDPFCGSGTVGQACRELGRRFIGLDLNPKYLQENALPRSEQKTSAASLATLPMFAEAA
jgi:hypothetical protein